MLNMLKKVPLSVLILLLGVAPAMAVKGPHGVDRTIHNLSITPSTEKGEGWGFGKEEYATHEEEVCIFCHTPHGGVANGPLWNRTLPGAGTFTHYNSATLGDTGALPAGDMARPVSDESLLCLSCHDGSVATNRVINASNTLGGQPANIDQSPVVTTGGPDVDIEWMFGLPASRIGTMNFLDGGLDTDTGKLQDDHPISFSYTDAEGDANEQELYAIGVPSGRGIRFFGANSRVECSSCHDPHVKYDTALDGAADPAYAPFLITTNQGSYLCLSCHNK